MKYFAGLDGGATKTKCVLTDENLNVLSEATAGPSNFLIIGVEKVSETILSLLKEVSASAGINPSEITSIVIGSTGAGRYEEAMKLENGFKNHALLNGFRFDNFYVESDARIALEAAFSGKPGSILIAGTGSIMFGKDIEGNVHRVGGFGRFIGDEGSGYVIGRLGLTAAAKEFDGRGEKTLFTRLLKEKTGIDNPSALISKVYKDNFDIPSVAPLVMEAAEKGDEICLKIIENQCDELLLHIKAMQIKISVDPFYLSLIGSPLTKETIYSKMLKEKVEREFGNVIIKSADHTPEIGAVLLAINKTKL